MKDVSNAWVGKDGEKLKRKKFTGEILRRPSMSMSKTNNKKSKCTIGGGNPPGSTKAKRIFAYCLPGGKLKIVST